MHSPYSAGIALMTGEINGHKQKEPVNGKAERAIKAAHWFDQLLEAARVMQPITLTRGKLELGEPVVPKTSAEVTASHLKS